MKVLPAIFLFFMLIGVTSSMAFAGQYEIALRSVQPDGQGHLVSCDEDNEPPCHFALNVPEIGRIDGVIAFKGNGLIEFYFRHQGRLLSNERIGKDYYPVFMSGRSFAKENMTVYLADVPERSKTGAQAIIRSSGGPSIDIEVVISRPGTAGPTDSSPRS